MGSSRFVRECGAYWELVDGGVFYAFAERAPGRLGRTRSRRAFFAEIARLREEPVTADEELAKAKRQLEVMLVTGLRTNHALASRIGREHATFGRIRPLTELLEGIHVRDDRRTSSASPRST